MDLELASNYSSKVVPEQIDFTSNIALITWQVSHIWCIRDHVLNSKDIEQFLGKLFHHNPFSSQHISEDRSWEQRVDISTWLLSLDIAVVDHDYINQIVRMARSDLEKSEDDPELIAKARTLLNSITVPLNGWKISETFEMRCPVGPTNMVLFEVDSHYIFLEVHNES